jgi:site-specific DNA-methyltransferase (adenine-specific)
MGAIIWQKVATTNTTGGATIMGSFPFPRNGILKLDYEFILVFKKPGKSQKKVLKETKEQSKMTKEEWNTYFTGHWKFSGIRQEDHIAMFPLELPTRLIKMFTFVGDAVLDPFLGSGTTSLAAIELNRNSVGYEINANYIPIIKNKLGISERKLFNQPEYRLITQKSLTIDIEKEIEKLPYIFKDPVKLNKKIDPKKLQFGSKIDKNSSKREDYYSIKKIISPEILILNNDLKIRLIGIKKNKKKNGEAVDFLEEILKGQKVFLKFDKKKHDSENNLLCYLYLKNKTFVNAHLLKKNLVQVDETYYFKYKDKFQRYKEQING